MEDCGDTVGLDQIEASFGRNVRRIVEGETKFCKLPSHLSRGGSGFAGGGGASLSRDGGASSDSEDASRPLRLTALLDSAPAPSGSLNGGAATNGDSGSGSGSSGSDSEGGGPQLGNANGATSAGSSLECVELLEGFGDSMLSSEPESEGPGSGAEGEPAAPPPKPSTFSTADGGRAVGGLAALAPERCAALWMHLAARL